MKMRRYEYGGYLGLELPRKKEYFDNLPVDDVLKVNCGRTAFYCAVIDLNVKKVYCPYLNCENSVDPIKKAGVEIEYYYLNDDLTPKNISPQNNEAVLWVNYYGNASKEMIEKVCRQFPNLIIDNCHAFFSKPMSGAYNCYSARKFFGVADGGYVIHNNINKMKDSLPNSYSADFSSYLLKTIEIGTNAAYKMNLENECRLENNIARMSRLTQKILSSIDYREIRIKRQNNILKLHNKLKHINEFAVNINSCTQMYYPLLVRNNNLREKLIQNHIYTPTWWRHVPKQCNYSRLETLLAQYVVLLPIDQRYDDDDMDNIADIVNNLIE